MTTTTTSLAPVRHISPSVAGMIRGLAHRAVLPSILRRAAETSTDMPAPGDRRSAVDHLQDVIDTVCGVGFVYGPPRSSYDAAAGAYRVSGNWRRGVREPTPRVRREWERQGLVRPEDWPPATYCSGAAMLLASMYAGAEDAYEPSWSGSSTEALLGRWWRPTKTRPETWRIAPVWAPRWARPKKRPAYEYFPRRTSWAEMARTDGAALPCDLSLVIGYHHVVTIIRRREGLVHPLTRQPLRDHLVIAADGYGQRVDLDDDGKRDERYYSCKPLVVEYLQTRAAQRPGEESDDLVSIVGIREPDPIPGDVRIIVG